MNIALVFAFLFQIGSTIGWIIELFYRRFVSAKKWINPGFLTGPWLPIYGIGLCMLFALSFIDLSFIGDSRIEILLTIIFMGLFVTFIELIAGFIFIKGMKVKLWDYSNEWGNFQGIICPKYTFFWCILGAIYYFFIREYTIDTVIWFTNNLAYSFFVGFFFGIFIIDIVNSMNLATKLRKFADENEIFVRFEELKDSIREEQERQKERIHFIFPFKKPSTKTSFAAFSIT